jgi:hypothetical protein
LRSAAPAVKMPVISVQRRATLPPPSNAPVPSPEKTNVFAVFLCPLCQGGTIQP